MTADRVADPARSGPAYRLLSVGQLGNPRGTLLGFGGLRDGGGRVPCRWPPAALCWAVSGGTP